MIIGICKSMGFSGGEVAATNMNERVKKIFMVSGLQKADPGRYGIKNRHM